MRFLVFAILAVPTVAVIAAVADDRPTTARPDRCAREAVVETVGECTESRLGLLTSTVGACSAVTRSGARVTVLRPVMAGDRVCHYRNGFYKVFGQPVVM